MDLEKRLRVRSYRFLVAEERLLGMTYCGRHSEAFAEGRGIGAAWIWKSGFV
jgi:hypothetical protein